MDNLSHALAGLLIAEGVIQLKIARGTPPSPQFARSAYVVSAVANNLPDLDFLCARLTSPRSLGYLLHHRGHTHTALGALAMAALFVWVWGLALARIRRGLAPGEWSWLWLLGLSGALVHIAMDSSNNYGVHPFWPLYDGWLYGDFVFIVEPLFFAVGIPPLLFAFRSRLARVVLALVLVAIVTLTWLIPFVAFWVALLVTLVSLGALLLARTQSPAARILCAFASAAALVLVFGAMHFRARSLATAALPADARLEDVV
ncbi:MAG TPA: metal-dependent hydrolase, partial [Polyangiaceae bacterium]|nr:metal-dependent hydrolase [Polyangiaceae bacterium]